MHSNIYPEDFKNQLIRGTSDLSQRQNLIRLWLESQAAQYPECSPEAVSNFPDSYVSIPLEDFFKQMLTGNHPEIFYEYLLILKRKAIAIPAHLVPIAIQNCKADYRMMSLLQSVLGEAGIFLCLQNKNWSWILENNSKDPFLWSDQEARFFVFRNLLSIDSENAFHFFLKYSSNLKPAEINSCISRLIPYIHKLSFDVQLVLPILKGKNQIWILPFILNSIHQDELLELFELFRQILMQKNSLEIPVFSNKSKQKKNISLSDFIRFLPSTFWKNNSEDYTIFKQIQEINLLSSLIQNIVYHQNSALANRLLEWIIDQHLFLEQLPVFQLAEVLNFKEFNQHLIAVFNKEREQIDLEAVFHFLKSSHHFWDDRLLEWICWLHGQSIPERNYQLEVFFEMIPFRMNPALDFITKIPQPIRKRIKLNPSAEKILQFRKMMR